jgi:putative ABC transport system substrate-binding protein
VSILVPELDGKRLEILMELVPQARRLAALADPNVAGHRQALQDAARTRGVELSIHLAAKAEAILPAIESANASGAALNVMASQLFWINRKLIIDRTTALRLPTMFWWPDLVEEGGLVGYGPPLNEIFRRQMARLLVKLLQGAKPAGLPVEQPTAFKLVVNLKTANAIGLAVPTLLLNRADELIE